MDAIEIEFKAKELGLKRLRRKKELEEAGKSTNLGVSNEEKENIALLHKIKFSEESIETLYCLTVSIDTIRRIIGDSEKA